MKNYVKSLFVTLALLASLLLFGCGGKDPLTYKNFEAAEKAWEEDRRADLPAEKVEARKFFFEQAKRYENSK
jgi:predicted small lipoprotein YifL